LQGFLGKAGLKENLIPIFVESWGIWGGEFLKKGREKMAAVGRKVRDIGWEMSVTVEEGIPTVRGTYCFYVFICFIFFGAF
jgi:hypothetical protein